MTELCPNCLEEMVEQWDYEKDVPALYCPDCGELVYPDSFTIAIIEKRSGIDIVISNTK